MRAVVWPGFQVGYPLGLWCWLSGVANLHNITYTQPHGRWTHPDGLGLPEGWQGAPAAVFAFGTGRVGPEVQARQVQVLDEDDVDLPCTDCLHKLFGIAHCNRRTALLQASPAVLSRHRVSMICMNAHVDGPVDVVWLRAAPSLASARPPSNRTWSWLQGCGG